MPVIPDIVNRFSTKTPSVLGDWDTRISAYKTVKFIVNNRMTPDESAYWTPSLIYEFLFSIPIEDVEALNALPTEDLRWFFDECVMDLAYAKNVIEALMG
jgi:hypothetical protein